MERVYAAPGVIVQNDVGWGAIGLIIGALLTGLFGWLIQRSKGGTDVEVAAIGEWQKLYNALSSRVSDLEQQLADLRRSHASEIEQIITDHADAMETLKANHREEMKTLRDYCEGLERQIAQNSQSTAHLMGQFPKGKGNGD